MSELKMDIIGMEFLLECRKDSEWAFLTDSDLIRATMNEAMYPCIQSVNGEWYQSWNSVTFHIMGKKFVAIVTAENPDWAQSVNKAFPMDEGIIGFPVHIKNGERMDAKNLRKAIHAHITDMRPELAKPEWSSWEELAEFIKPLAWQWKPWLANGTLAICAGEPGMGKSKLLLRITGCYTDGLAWPDGTPFTGDKGKVIWCESEAAQYLNMERAMASQLSLKDIVFPFKGEAGLYTDFKLDNHHHKEKLWGLAYNNDVKLIILDALRGLHSRNENSSEVAGLVGMLAGLARDTNKPILLAHHLRKRSIFDGDGINLDRVRGSSAIIQTSRLVWGIDSPDQNDLENRRLSVIKSNLAKFPEPIGMRIDDNGVHFGAAPLPPQKYTPLDMAIDFIKDYLNSSPMPSSSVFDEAEGAGISIATLKRAKNKLGVISQKKYEDGKSMWFWSLPHKN